MKYTDKLGLPIWNEPETDVFDIQEFNKGNQAIDNIVVDILKKINNLVIGDTQIDLDGYVKEEVLKEYVKKEVLKEYAERIAKKADKEEIEEISLQLDTKANLQDVMELKSSFIKPYFVEGFASVTGYGLGTVSGWEKYTENNMKGNYTATCNGVKGENFVTVTSNNISDGGDKWACIIKVNDSKNGYIFNKVIGIENNKFLLYKPLEVSFNNCIIANLQDIPNGQHLTQEGYYAFAQNIYNSNPKHCQRDSYIKRSKGTDTSSDWKTNDVINYNYSFNIISEANNKIFNNVSGKTTSCYMRDNSKYLEWEISVEGYNGYLELICGPTNLSECIAEFYLDDILVQTEKFDMVKRMCFDFSNSTKAKIKLMPSSSAVFPLNIGVTSATWYVNSKYDKTLLDKFNNIAYIGDSWGEFHNRATTRELSRLCGKTVTDYSKGGHTSKYAQAWFDEYIIKNKHDCVIIEYFTNDFNSFSSSWEGECLAPDGSTINMKLTDLNEYKKIMNEMINKAIDNGIQPIVILPHSTNSHAQTQTFGTYSIDLFEGSSLVNEEISAKTIESNIITTQILKGKDAKRGNPLKIITTEENSSIHKGMVIDTTKQITSASLVEFLNNGETKSSINFDGSATVQSVKLKDTIYVVPNDEGTRGKLFLFNNETTSNNDELRIVIKLSDGTYVQKKIKLEDV